jgi:TPR repeat protein
MYQNGWGVEQDYKIAEEYFHKAINRGETTGYSALAVMKEKHLPNPDYKEILNLFLKDAPNGHPNAIMGIQRLYAEHPKETNLIQEDVLFWKYVQKYQMVAHLGFPKIILENRSKYHDGLTENKILEIREKAEALAKSFSHL